MTFSKEDLLRQDVIPVIFVRAVYLFGELTLHPLMNNKGLWVSGGNIDPPPDIDKDFGLPMTLALRHLIQFCDNADKAREKLLSLHTTGGRVHNVMIVDTRGKMLYRHQDPEKDTYYIGSRSNQRVNIGIPDDGDNGIYLQATGPAGMNITAGSAPQDHMDVTYTFYTLKLKSSEVQIIQEAEFTAGERLAAADAAIKKMDRSLQLLPARLALRDLFTKACRELEQGRRHAVAARLAEGDEQRYLWGKTVTCYVRAESKFREVYNYIHPPAEKPEDLGLEPIEPPRPELDTFEERTYRRIFEEGI